PKRRHDNSAGGGKKSLRILITGMCFAFPIGRVPTGIRYGAQVALSSPRLTWMRDSDWALCPAGVPFTHTNTHIHNTTQHSTTQHSTTHPTTPHNTTLYGYTHHNTTQHKTTQQEKHTPTTTQDQRHSNTV